MSELGASVIAASGFLRSFFSDVSKLLTVVEGEMTGSGLISPFGTGSIWNRSSSYAFPSLWIPNYVARQYVEAPPEGAKVSNVAGWYAFVVVHFAPQAVGEPSVIWGTATLKSVQYVWTSLNKLVLAERGPKFLTRIPVEDWQILPEPGQDLRELRYRARAVVDLCDETTVQQVVVQPLLELVEQVRAESQGA